MVKEYLVSYFMYLYYDDKVDLPSLFSTVVHAESKRDAYNIVGEEIIKNNKRSGIISITLLDE